jgi:NADH-quinone oxidoreductase subunit H
VTCDAEGLMNGMVGFLWVCVSLLVFVLFYVCVLLGVAYFTLFERKILSYSQGRVGPRKSGGFGLFQPLLDGLKLLGKESFFTVQSGMILFSVLPLSLLPFMFVS